VVQHRGEGWEQAPPTTAAPVHAVVTSLFRCATCRDSCRVVKPSTLFLGQTVDGFCPPRLRHLGASSDPARERTPPPAPVRHVDRAAHCRRIGQTGWLTTFERYGVAHVRAIGKAGYRAAVAACGVAFVNGLVMAKRWHGPCRPELLIELVAGDVLANLDRAA
jgi:hypothetical protein